MQTERFQPNPQYLIALRLGITILLLLLAGSMVLVWLMEYGDAALIVTLAATLVGWVVTLILAKPSEESPTRITNLDDDNSPSRRLC